jgi:hypothetical protein
MTLPTSIDTPTVTRPLRLKIAVVWLLATQPVMGLVLVFSLPLSIEERFVGCVVAAFIAWVLYGVWYFRRWAKYPLIALLIVTLFMTVSEIPNFPDLDSIGRFVVGLLWAGADAVAFDELKKAVKINPPVI